jgi:predicted peptidase
MRIRRLAEFVVAVILAGCTATEESGMVDGKQQAVTFSTTVTSEVKTKYLLYLPEGYGTTDQRWPLVLFLHGSGERGSDPEVVKRHGPPKLVERGKKFPFILVSPQCPEEERWSVPVLRALLDEIERKYAVDRSREYITGLSMGGNGTWRMAAANPEKFAAIAPICGYGDPATVCVLKHKPIWVFHGKLDKTVPVEKSESLVNTLKACGSDVRFTVYPETGHDSWSETYDNPAFYEWMLAQKLR